MIYLISSVINMVDVLFSFEHLKWSKGPLIFDVTATSEVYLKTLEQTIMNTLENTFYDNDAYCVQQDGTLPPYHRDVREFLDNAFPTQCIGRRGRRGSASDNQPRSPDLNPTYLSGVTVRVWKTLSMEKSQGTYNL